MEYNETNQIKYPNPDQMEAPLSLGQWIITLIVLMIPCVGWIMLFVWGFGSGNVSRKNFCRAQLIVGAVLLVLMIILYAIVGVSLFTAMNSYNYY